MDHKKHIFILYGLIAVLFIASFAWMVENYTSVNNHMRSMHGLMSNKEMSLMMKDVMGADNIDDLPLKKESDRISALEPALRNGVKEFTLSAEPIRWEYAKGKTITAWGYNGQIPGPEIRVQEGDKIRVVFTNKLPKATTIHWHGITVPYTQDGVPGVSQEAIKPGETFTYEFTANPAGTRFYHAHGASHADEAQQLDMGLSGAFIIEGKKEVKADKDITLILDEWQTGSPNGASHNMAMMGSHNAGQSGQSGHSMNYNLFTINGQSFPDAAPIRVQKGERVKLRLINAGTSTIHPMHLHGHSFKVVATDGNVVPDSAQLTKDTIMVGPGERYDIEFVADNEGVWLFHCHELHHADGGMVTTLLYDGFKPIEDVNTTANDEGTSGSSDNANGGHMMHGM